MIRMQNTIEKKDKMERIHGYSVSTYPGLTEEGEDKLFDLCESLVLSESNGPLENEDWSLIREEARIDAKQKSSEKVFTIWIDMNKEMENAMADYYKWEKKRYENVQRINNRIIKAIESVKGKEFAKDFLECAGEMEVGAQDWSFVKKPVGIFQEEDYGLIQGIWVDQWRNGGYEGDDFAGDIYIKLKENIFLKMGYEC